MSNTLAYADRDTPRDGRPRWMLRIAMIWTALVAWAEVLLLFGPLGRWISSGSFLSVSLFAIAPIVGLGLAIAAMVTIIWHLRDGWPVILGIANFLTAAMLMFAGWAILMLLQM